MGMLRNIGLATMLTAGAANIGMGISALNDAVPKDYQALQSMADRYSTMAVISHVNNYLYLMGGITFALAGRRRAYDSGD